MMEYKNGERVLMFSSRDICYSSGNFFANQLGAAFEELGFEADVCEFSKYGDIDEQLMPYMEKKYRVIVDFNSMLPRMLLEDDSHYQDHLNGPFFDYILDHPLFHDISLKEQAGNFHVLTLDEAQERYVRRYYPHIKSVHMLPLGATEAFYHGKKQAADHILFMGTFDTSKKVAQIIERAEQPFRDIMKNLAERRIAEPFLSMEDVYLQYLEEHGEQLTPKQFAKNLHDMYPVDAYVRNYYREKTIDTLLLHGIPVKVVGEGWEEYQSADEKILIREKSVDFPLSFEKIAREAIVLNVSPMFNHGMHDRIPGGMANHTVVLTDRNPYLERQFTDKKELCFYDLSNLDTLCESAELLMQNPDLRETIAENAYSEFVNKHTWKCRAKQILEFADAWQNRGGEGQCRS